MLRELKELQAKLDEPTPSDIGDVGEMENRTVLEGFYAYIR